MQVQWSTYREYDEASVRRFVLTKPGVYILWVQLQTGGKRCFYVGKAEDLERRLLDHLSPAEPNACLKTKVAKFACGLHWAVVEAEASRTSVEKFLYDSFRRPECNENDPGGTPVQVNLPPD